ncbi:hypothetical protein UFOVP27_123 [uncultured Caudovirales phage]|uniref:Uncharacterized protein n=1 Tax=uncultured Caudovirales phage TaxID=2100421 RepID=A0A6J5KM47_9CAUD|nr:hypothetical protein UFOVP27_123 [uncultured Caudovirales phage]
MTKCLNCDLDATYRLDNQGTVIQYFCDVDLPGFLNKRALPEHVAVITKEFDEHKDADTIVKKNRAKNIKKRSLNRDSIKIEEIAEWI